MGALCDLWDISNIPEDLITIPHNSKPYFSNQNLRTSFAHADFCPVAVTPLGVDCTQDTPSYTPFYDGETGGRNSRCINAFSIMARNGYKRQRPACMDIE